MQLSTSPSTTDTDNDSQSRNCWYHIWLHLQCALLYIQEFNTAMFEYRCNISQQIHFQLEIEGSGQAVAWPHTNADRKLIQECCKLALGDVA